MPKLSVLRKNPAEEETILTKQELAQWAMEYILLFFSDKKFYCGGPIPRCEMLMKKNVEAVINVNYEFGFKFAYRYLFPCLKVEKDQIFKRSHYHGELPFHVYYCLKLLKDMKGKGIPKLFHPGLVLLYFQFCKGCNFEVPRKQIRYPL